MDLGVFDSGGEARRLGERWLLICDLVGGAVGAAIAIVVLVTLIS
jgi:uncharacterized membrane protein YsdA (DUF1294 family)